MKRGLFVFVGTVILLAMPTSFAADCGDVNNDGNIDILDIVCLINYKYKGGPEPLCGAVMDIDGNIYQTVTVGTQVWMAENLKVTHYRNGDPIPNVTDGTEWAGIVTGAYCNYNNDEGYVGTYGRLYNWYAAVDTRNIAPTGWHVPTDAEWQTLADYLSGDAIAGGKMKEAGTAHWQSPNTGATNESGFSGLPGGYRLYYGDYSGGGGVTDFWSATEIDGYAAWNRGLYYNNSMANRGGGYNYFGFSIRCVKD